LVVEMNVHGLRRTIHNMARPLVSREFLKSITGHATDQMVEHYSVVSPQEKRAAAAGVLERQLPWHRGRSKRTRYPSIYVLAPVDGIVRSVEVSESGPIRVGDRVFSFIRSAVGQCYATSDGGSGKDGQERFLTSGPGVLVPVWTGWRRSWS
jgi:hypothetical protein